MLQLRPGADKHTHTHTPGARFKHTYTNCGQGQRSKHTHTHIYKLYTHTYINCTHTHTHTHTYIYKLWPGGEVLTSQSPKFCSCEVSPGPELYHQILAPLSSANRFLLFCSCLAFVNLNTTFQAPSEVPPGFLSAVHRPQRPWPEKKARAAERQVSRGTWRRAEGTELAFLAPSARLPRGASVYWPLRTSFKGPQVALRKRDAQQALPSAFAAGVLAPEAMVLP